MCPGMGSSAFAESSRRLGSASGGATEASAVHSLNFRCACVERRRGISREGTAGMGGAGTRSRHCAWALVGCVVIGVLVAQTGCGGGSIAPPQSDAQDRLAKLMNLYRLYVEKTKKPPANEEALREFHKSLSEQERTDRLIG